MSNNSVSISDLDKATVLAALYNASKPLGLGFLHYDPKPMTREEAEEVLKDTQYFDYLQGRVMKIDLSHPEEVHTGLYNRDNGEGAFETVIEKLRATGDVNSVDTQFTHHLNTYRSAEYVRDHLEPSRIEGNVCALGFGDSDVAEALGPKIAKVLK